MEIGGNTVLITGGATGIGLALAVRFLKAGSQVIICGRRKAKLEEAKLNHPELHIRVCDVGLEEERNALFLWTVAEFPQVNVLINNAGIQRRVEATKDQDSWEERRKEIAINLEAPIHLSSLFVPHFITQPKAAIINVSSGLAFTPGTFATIYSATKAALHSFTMSLRYELEGTPVKVLEIVPPAVNTDLGGAGIHTMGVPLDEFADAIMQRLAGGEVEIGYGRSEKARNASRQESDEMIRQMNRKE
ncbi:SDR family oxidoreductase [Adhaeribacter soli]|uniref:SDR family NAD(P)-dependent oxidoreductase n=1 Tax=Adhaeribacter soli TaxID=2607655 RepID=A0A5N1J6K0_9BACT|nr:SDR family NAD(P)-dependent oxidoreductase [Adhaeribacter soli]KAA9345582.1 SDR family NAD(P)-dependent oxidoreductase [Adhaeribacter soli]